MSRKSKIIVSLLLVALTIGGTFFILSSWQTPPLPERPPPEVVKPAPPPEVVPLPSKPKPPVVKGKKKKSKPEPKKPKPKKPEPKKPAECLPEERDWLTGNCRLPNQ